MLPDNVNYLKGLCYLKIVRLPSQVMMRALIGLLLRPPLYVFTQRHDKIAIPFYSHVIMLFPIILI